MCEATGTAAGGVQQEGSSEESMDYGVAKQAAIPPPVEWGGPKSFNIKKSEITDIIPRYHEKLPPKVKKNNWLPTPDMVLPQETFDDHAADTMAKAGLYTWTVGEANTSADRWRYVGQAGEVVKGGSLADSEVRMYSAQGFRLLTRHSGPKGQPLTDAELKREMDENTALIGKLAAWTQAGLKANYATRSDQQRSLDMSTQVVFHSAGYNVNTLTNTVQPRADKAPTSEDGSPETYAV